jgi:sulfide:quinone oxidoreductase
MGPVFLRARLRVAADENLGGNAHRCGVIGVWPSSGGAAHVVIAGGGFAALEAALALSALAADRARVTLISPDPVFAYRPAATAEAFVEAPPLSYDLEAIAADLGASYRRGRLEAVASQEKHVRLASFARLSYDALVLAIGTRASAAVPGALTFRDQRDVPLFRSLLQELEAGGVGRLVFAVPPGCSWPLPLYELALLSAMHVQEYHVGTEITVVSPEQTPLAIFGAEASRLIAGLLAERGVRFVGDSAPSNVRGDGSLELQFGGALRADRVVAATQLRAEPITGVPASPWGFVATDALGRVADLADVYAAGDMTTSAIKQGGLATQQTDRIAHTIAKKIGIDVGEFRAARVLSARLLSGERPIFLRTELEEDGRPTKATFEQTDTDEPASSSKVFGRYLTPYLDTREPLASWV